MKHDTAQDLPALLFQTTLEWYHRITSGQSRLFPKGSESRELTFKCFVVPNII